MQWLEEMGTVCNAMCDPDVCGQNWRLVLEPVQLRRAARRMLAEGYFLEDITCLDMKEGIVVLYHFDRYSAHGRITLKVVLPHDAAQVPSVAGIYQGAEWHERECMDFYAVTFTGNPNPSRLLLPDDMDEKPLMKPEKKRVSMVEVFCITDLVHCSSDHPVAKAMEEKFAAMKEEQAKAEAEAAAAADAEAAPAEDAKSE